MQSSWFSSSSYTPPLAQSVLGLEGLKFGDVVSKLGRPFARLHFGTLANRSVATAAFVQRTVPVPSGADDIPEILDRRIREIVLESTASSLTKAKLDADAAVRDSTGAVRRAALSASDKPTTHLVQVGSLTDSRARWRTICGWKFGNSNADRVSTKLAHCKDCLRAQAKLGLRESGDQL